MGERRFQGAKVGEQITVTLSWPQIASLWLSDLRWFIAGLLVAHHSWIGVVYAVALGAPLSLARHVLRYIDNSHKEAHRG